MNSLEPRRPRVAFDSRGFCVGVPGRQSARIEWQDVVEIFAFKYDLFCCDEIVLGFRLAGEDATFVEVSKEADGYRELMGELESRFPRIRSDWFSEVAVPAFAENQTTLWERSSIK